MAEYEVRILERFGETITIVAEAEISYKRRLKADGSCTLTIPLDDETISDPLALHPWAREVMLRRRETPESPWVVAHDGPITGTSFDLDAGTVTVTAGTVKSFLTKRAGGGYFNEPGYDLGAIADLIITRAQDRGLDPLPAGSTFFCDHPLVTTGVTRDFDTRSQGARKYNEILDEFANGSPGFDYDFVTTYDAGVRTRTFVLYYPTQGTDVATPLVYGSSLIGGNVTIDGDRAATHYLILGTPKGDATKQANVFVDDTIIDLYTRLEEVETQSDIDDATRLHDLAVEALRLRVPPLYLLAGTYKVCEATPWRFAKVGDTVPLRISRGPVQINNRRRVIGESVSVGAGGSETVTLEFNDPVSP